ncbi:MAG: DUF1573 domain-containing protein [Planctomycetota bacterium]|nr:DUF1573 domain-containing protein [Planctomycetota bacterium]MDA1212447.1 DUF1573 domain-containing protein [Planctomycetota bacterium]
MRFTSVLVGFVCLIVALSFTVWVGGGGQSSAVDRYRSAPADPPPDEDASKSPESPDVAKGADGHDHDHDHDADEGDRTEEDSPDLSESGPYPKVQTEQASFNFGVMEPETDGEHLFTIRNDGEAALILRRGKSTCQCTRFDILKSEIAPGETGDILVKWKPKNADRNFEQSLQVKTNDPTQTLVKLTVSGLVEPKVVLAPNSPWNAGTYAGTDPSSPKVGTLTSRMVDDLQVESVEIEHPELVSVNLTPIAADDDLIVKEKYRSGVRIEVVLQPVIPIGSFSEKITLHTNVPQFENIDLEITGSRSGSIRIYPTQGVRFDPDRMLISMGQFPSQEGKKVQLRMIINDMDEDFEISDIETDPSNLKMTMEKDPAKFDDPTRRRFLLTFEVPPNGPSHARTFENIAKIKFKTNHPRSKEMTFYFDYIAL